VTVGLHPFPLQEAYDAVSVGRSLADYLALPLDQYSLLDPKWISRPDPDGQPDTFLLRVPLAGIPHLHLEPQARCWAGREARREEHERR
jgi:hypothetical protein